MSAYPDCPVVAVIAVVVRAGAVLLVRRANPPDEGKFGFPGGRVELGESLAHAALRELAEETGVAAEVLEVLTAVDAIDRDVGGDTRFHYVLVAVLCRWRSGEGAAANDVSELRWTLPSEIERGDIVVSRDVARVARMGVGRVKDPKGSGLS